ncbi:MAG: hypothetical protein P8099_08690 [Gemmatimonadota bacterium]
MFAFAYNRGRRTRPALAPGIRPVAYVKSHRLLKTLLRENPELDEIMRNAANETEALVGLRNLVLKELRRRPAALAYYEAEHATRDQFEALEWGDFAGIRLLDYIDHAGREFEDLNLRGELAVSDPIRAIWLAVHHGTGGAKPAFFEDMLHLFRQFTGRSEASGRRRQTGRGWRRGWSATRRGWTRGSSSCGRRTGTGSSACSWTGWTGARYRAPGTGSGRARRGSRSELACWSGGRTCTST